MYEPLNLPEPRATITNAPFRKDSAVHSQTLETLVTVTDYPELRSTLIQLLIRYHDFFALPGEPLGATDRAEHHLKLITDTDSICTSVYRLPHNQRQVVEEQIKHMLEQDVKKNSRLPWNPPLFLVPKRKRTFLAC